MVVLTSYTAGTYKAQIRSSLAGGFKQLYTASCTMSEGHAAKAVVDKNYGNIAASKVRQIKDAAEIGELCGDFFKDPKRKQVFNVWTFDTRAKASKPSAPSDEPPAPEWIGKPQPNAIDGKAEVVTTGSPAVTGPEDPRWLAVRESAGRLKEAGRTFLEIQAWLGWQLAQLKKDHGVQRGKNQHGGSAESADPRTWDDLVKHYTGYSRRTADVFIQLFEATKAKLKRAKAPAQKAALAVFNQGNPLALPDDQRGYVRDVISSLCTGETQGSLMEQLGIVPKPVMPKRTKAQEEDDDKLTDIELAHHHWEGTAKAIVTARSPEGVKLLHVLPTVTDEPGKLSLVFLREETAALLAAVEEAMATAAKPAKRKP